ncbi:MAG TPA: 30S ribosomal protein S20 [Candidatus Saccharimonadales bacterium]|nr:30S ribosomal protein S20 [Candidatus Saccharimonadales bacterium]
MPIIKSAIKQMRQAAKSRLRNSATKRTLKAAVKAFQVKSSPDSFKKAQSEIDKAVKKNLLSKNTAARRKAALAKVAKAAATEAPAKKKPVAKKTAAKAPAKKTVAKKAAK